MVDLVEPWFGLNVEEYRPYLARRTPFLVIGTSIS